MTECAQCGREPVLDVDGDPPLRWTADHAVAGEPIRWTCPDCTRRHLRAIEGKLERDWW